MTRDKFAQPYLVALYKEHRRNRSHRPSITELVRGYAVPRDEYLEGEMYEYFVAHGWAADPTLSTDHTSARLLISPEGKARAEQFIEMGIDPLIKIEYPSELAIVPAANRLVRRTDNLDSFLTAENALQALAEGLAAANNFGGLSVDEVEEAKREIWILTQAIRLEALRVDWIEAVAKTSLTWIATKAAEQAVGILAAAALSALAVLFGFTI